VTGLTYTLFGDGRSDQLLDYPIRWALAALGVRVELGQWADLSRTTPRPVTLTERARAALELYPAELLFVHRDAEATAPSARIEEVHRAVESVAAPHVAIVPVRMTEAWFLHDESAIRRASGNPNGTAGLSLPTPARVEFVVDPKSTLKTALLAASELTGRRLEKRKAEFSEMRRRTAELISDFEPLTAAPAFQAFLASLRSALVSLGRLGAES
jgi:hypothetical protein